MAVKKFKFISPEGAYGTAQGIYGAMIRAIGRENTEKLPPYGINWIDNSDGKGVIVSKVDGVELGYVEIIYV